MPAKKFFRIADRGTYSHIFNKGVEQRLIFNDDKDYQTFLGYLKDYLTAPQESEASKEVFTIKGRAFMGRPHQPKNYFKKVELIAYSLMPDHFHLLLYQNAEKSIESFIRSLCTRYSIYYNKKYQRTGPLFEGPYKSIQIKQTALLPHLAANIHHDSPYSSSPEYSGKRETSWVNLKAALSSSGDVDQEALQALALEPKNEHLERRLLEESLTKTSSKKIKPENPASQHRIPEFMAISGFFLILLSLGIRNINAQSATKVEYVAPSPIALATAGPVSLVPEAAVLPSATSVPLVKIKVDDISVNVNIRKSAAINSEIVGKARNGDIFELVSIDSEWSQIKLADGSLGFISARVAEIESSAY